MAHEGMVHNKVLHYSIYFQVIIQINKAARKNTFPGCLPLPGVFAAVAGILAVDEGNLSGCG